MKRLHAALLAALPAALAACGSTPPPGGDSPAIPSDDDPQRLVLATVDATPITLADAMGAYTSSHGSGHDVLVQSAPALRELVGRLVERRLFHAEAEALGIPDDAELRLAVADYRQKLAEMAFWRREVDERVAVSDDEVEAFYAKTDQALDLSVVECEERAEAAALLERVRAGEELADLAQEHSIHASSSFGGTLTYVRRGEIEPALEDAVFALEEAGELTGLVRTERGWAFARLDARAVNPIRPAREVALPQIRNILEGRREDELRAEVEERVRRAGDAEVDPTRLTRADVLGSDHADAVLAAADGETLTLGELRDALDLEAVRQASEEQVAAFLVELAHDWTLDRSVGRVVKESGLLDDPDVAQKADEFQRNAVLQTLYRDYVYVDVDVSDEAVRAYYEERRDTEFTRPPEVRMAYIVLETEERAREVLTALDGGQSFTDLARAHSIDPTSSAHGGRIGWIRPGQILPAVEEVAFALETDAVGGPIETDAGWFIVQALDRKEAQPVPFEQARATAVGRCRTARQKEAYGEWALRLRERAAIEFHEEELARAVAWLEAQSAAAAAGGGEPAAGPPPQGHGTPPPPVTSGAHPESESTP